MREPSSMDECVYFTRRAVGSGFVSAWVFREKCPKCQKEVMGKPRDKSGKVKVRAQDYVCPSCNYTVAKEEYEDSLTCFAKYVCPSCKSEGEAEVPFNRKKVRRVDEVSGKKEMVDVVRFECSKCKANIDVTKKMK